MFHVKQDSLTALSVARLAAERAGDLIRSRWDSPLRIDHKGEVDLVTEVDLAAEAVIVDTLSTAFPADRIVAEEGGARSAAASNTRTWIIDPLDGTTNFSHGLPHFCVSIALWDDEGALVGVVHEPIRRWTFHATRGGGAWRNETPLAVSACPSIDQALIATGFPYDRRANPQNNTAEFAHMVRTGQGMRRAGAAALDLAYVAAGWLDGYWEDRLKAWDIAAGTLLVREAGGIVTGMDGSPLDLENGHVAAGAPQIHSALVAELRAARSSHTSAS
jgi:myo-inositol-1(or 4)-monophosphatase